MRGALRAGRAAGVALVGILGAAIIASSSPGISLTEASWTEKEWVNGKMGVIDCNNNAAFATRGAGTFLGVDLLGIPLSSVAAVSGVVVTKSGSAPSVVQPASTPQIGAGTNIFANPVNVALLNSALNLNLTGVLTIPLGAQVGAVNEYAQSQGGGYSAGASGLVNNSGGIDIGSYPTPGSIPRSASLDLRSVVASALGSGGAALVGQVTDLDLEVGAVAAVAQLDACDADFANTLVGNLIRQYLIAGLQLDIDSPLVGDLTTSVSNTVTSLQTLLNGLSSNSGVVPAITSRLTTLLNGLLGALSLGSVTANLTATYNFSAVNSLLTAQVSDSNHIVMIDMGAGTVSIDLAALMGGPNGLNSLDPNTELLVNSTVINKLNTALFQALGDWATSVRTALDAAVNAITISGTVGITINSILTPVLSVGVVLTNASLASLVANTTPPANAAITISLLGGISCPPSVLHLTYALELILCPLLTGITTALTTGLRGVIGGAVMSLISPLTTGLSTTLTGLTTGVTAPLVRLLDLLLSGLFGTTGVASLLVNAQNDPLTGHPEPGDWASIPQGRYDVGALRVGVLGLLGPGTDVDIVLARGSVGANHLLP